MNHIAHGNWTGSVGFRGSAKKKTPSGDRNLAWGLASCAILGLGQRRGHHSTSAMNWRPSSLYATVTNTSSAGKTGRVWRQTGTNPCGSRKTNRLPIVLRRGTRRAPPAGGDRAPVFWEKFGVPCAKAEVVCCQWHTSAIGMARKWYCQRNSVVGGRGAYEKAGRIAGESLRELVLEMVISPRHDHEPVAAQFTRDALADHFTVNVSTLVRALNDLPVE